MDLHIDLGDRRELSNTIYCAISNAILDGTLRPGVALPPSRELARGLAVSRSTVTVAYDRLAGAGFLTTRVGAGTFVNRIQAEARGGGDRRRMRGPLAPQPKWLSLPIPEFPPVEFDFTSGLPDASLFPYDTWRRLLGRQFHAAAVGRGVYADPAGHRGLREAIARHVGVSRGVRIAAEDMTIVNGTQQALDLVTRVLVAPGEVVAIEDPGYGPARRAFQALGARVVAVPVDDHGLIVEQLPDDVRMVYVTPSHQFPLGVAMSSRRRLDLLSWASRTGAAIIEDDYDSEFRLGGPIDALQTLDRDGRVIFVGSFSKTMLPTLRLGFVATPPSLRSALHAAKHLTDWHTALPLQAALASFIGTGGFARHVRRMSAVYRTRHSVLSRAVCAELGAYLDVVPAAAGLHLCTVATPVGEPVVESAAAQALELGVAVQLLSEFSMNPAPRHGLVFGYGAIAADRIEAGIQRLRAAITA